MKREERRIKQNNFSPYGGINGRCFLRSFAYSIGGLESNANRSAVGKRLARKHFEYQPVKLRFINNKGEENAQPASLRSESFVRGKLLLWKFDRSFCLPLAGLLADYLYTTQFIVYALFKLSPDRGEMYFYGRKLERRRAFTRLSLIISRSNELSSRGMLSMKYVSMLTIRGKTYRIDKKAKKKKKMARTNVSDV